MILDNLVRLSVIKEISAVDGKPYIVEVESNGTDAAEEILGRLFANDTVQFLNAAWRVWRIEKNEITLVRLKK